MSGHRYPISYKVSFHDPPLTQEEATSEDRGACDALVIASVMRPPDGSLSVLIFGADGCEGKDLPPNDYFLVWMSMANHLAGMKGLGEDKRNFARGVFEAVRRALAASKADDSGKKN